ncbi:MAG: HEPN domain-containing protein [Bacteroidia bacterium]
MTEELRKYILQWYEKADHHLIFRNREIVKTHNLNFLLQECISQERSFETINLNELNNFAVTSRYPAEEETPELLEVLEYISIAEHVKQFVRSKIKLD